MGFVFTEVTLKNSRDTTAVVEGVSSEQEIRQKNVQALVDTGCYSVVITEKLRQELGLVIKGRKGVALANSERIICEQTEAVEIHWKDRYTALPALVVPDRPNVLLGALPLEAMDLIIDPVRQEVTGAHGDEWVSYI